MLKIETEGLAGNTAIGGYVGNWTVGDCVAALSAGEILLGMLLYFGAGTYPYYHATHCNFLDWGTEGDGYLVKFSREKGHSCQPGDKA